jgi:hypothetical protein
MSSALKLLLAVPAQPSSQGTNYGTSFPNGSLRQIRLLTTTLRAVPTTRETRNGFSKAAFSRNGNPLDRFYGFTVNVCFYQLSNLTAANAHVL